MERLIRFFVERHLLVNTITLAVVGSGGRGGGALNDTMSINDNIKLTAAYWTEVDENGATNYQDHALSATLDNEALSFEGGERYRLKR